MQSSQTVDALCVSPVKRKSKASNAQAAATLCPKAPSLAKAESPISPVKSKGSQQQQQQAMPKALPIQSTFTRGRSSDPLGSSSSSHHHGRSKSVSSKRSSKSAHDKLDSSSSSSSSPHDRNRAKSAAKSRSDDKLDLSSSHHRAKSAATSRSSNDKLDSSLSHHRAKSAAKSRSSNDNDDLKPGSTHKNNTRRPKSVAKSRSADDLTGLGGSSAHGSGHPNNLPRPKSVSKGRSAENLEEFKASTHGGTGRATRRPKSVAKSRSADDLEELRGSSTTESARGRSTSSRFNNPSDHKRSKSKTRVADDLLSSCIDAAKKNAQPTSSDNEKGSGSSHDKQKDTKSSSARQSFTPNPKKESPRRSSLLSNNSPIKSRSKAVEKTNRRSSTPIQRYNNKDLQADLDSNHSNGNAKKTSDRDSPRKEKGSECKSPKAKSKAQKMASCETDVSPRDYGNTTLTASSKSAYANKSKSGPVHHNTPPPILGHDGATTQQQARSFGDDSYQSPPQSPTGRKQKSNKNLESYQSPQSPGGRQNKSNKKLESYQSPQSPAGRQNKSNKKLASPGPQNPKRAEPVTPGRSVKERFLMAVTTPKRDLRPVTPRRSLRDSAILGQTLSLFENENTGKQPEAPVTCPRTPGRLSPQKAEEMFAKESSSADAPKTPRSSLRDGKFSKSLGTFENENDQNPLEMSLGSIGQKSPKKDLPRQCPLDLDMSESSDTTMPNSDVHDDSAQSLLELYDSADTMDFNEFVQEVPEIKEDVAADDPTKSNENAETAQEKKIGSLRAMVDRFEVRIKQAKLRSDGKSPPKLYNRPPVNVQQKSLLVKAEYKAPVFEKTQQQENQITGALSKCFAFDAMPKRNLKAIVSAFEPKRAKAGTEIHSSGMDDDVFYVVTDGELDVTIDGDRVGSVRSGETFGQSNLFHASSRKHEMSIKANRDTDVYKMDQETYRSIIEKETKAMEQRKRELLNQIKFLAKVSQEEKEKIVDVMKCANFEQGETISTDGANGKRLYIIDEGVARCRDTTIEVGQTFGDGAFDGSAKNAACDEAIAETDVSAFFIDLSSFETAVGPAEQVIERKPPLDLAQLDPAVSGYEKLRFDKRKTLTIEERKAVVSLFDDRVFEKGEVILDAKKTVPAGLYLLRYGLAQASSMGITKNVSFIMIGTFFAKDLFETALASKSNMGTSLDRVVALEKCVVSFLPVDEFKRAREIYLQKCNHRGYQSGDSSDDDSSSNDSSDDSDSSFGSDVYEVQEVARKIEFRNLVKKVLLGEGGYGQVWLVSDKTEIEPNGYALKIQSKYELSIAGDAEMAVREKNIMASVNHPNVINLLASYQDEQFLYFLLNLVQGGELYSLLNPVDPNAPLPDGLEEKQARFYVFGLADALAHVHKRGILYRDMKPENVLIDKYGYPVLVDFGLAKKIEKNEKTYTLRGTPGYLPPECILNVGHSFSADHWSLGILLYELLSGESPYFFEGVDTVELYRMVTEDPYPPLQSASGNAVSLLDGLLTKDPALRLGSLARGEAEIIHHKWFVGLEVEAMRKRKIRAPWIPKISDPFDASNFECWNDLEDKTDAHYPSLSAKDAAVFNDF